MDFLGDLNSVAREGERGYRKKDPFSTAREGEMRMAMAGGIKPTATDLGWPEDMGDEDKALLIYLMMNHNKIKGGPKTLEEKS